jgi:hypothetical protein
VNHPIRHILNCRTCSFIPKSRLTFVTDTFRRSAYQKCLTIHRSRHVESLSCRLSVAIPCGSTSDSFRGSGPRSRKKANRMAKPIRVLPRLDIISVLSPKYEVFCCDHNGPPVRRSEPDWRKEGAYLNRYVTDEQRGRRPIFIATLWAGASWLFFRVARSTRMTQIWALLRQSGSDRLEKQPTDLRQNTSYFGDRTLGLHVL